MNYGDFSSLVQLGVGLHAGTALLQLYLEIAATPFERKLQRLHNLCVSRKISDHELLDDVEQLSADFDIFKVQLFNEFKRFVAINFGVAAILLVILIFISYRASSAVDPITATIGVFLSVLPGPITLAALWIAASRKLKPLREKAASLQRSALSYNSARTV